MIKWNKDNGIHVFRLSSEMFPHISNPELFKFDEAAGREYYSLEWAQEKLGEIGALATELSIRLTFHPGQFNQVGAKDEKVFIKTMVDLNWHARVLEMLGAANAVMVVHGGGTYGDKAATIKRWETNYHRLPEVVKRFLVLENCEKCYSVEDLLPLCKACNIPLVYDTHHYTCYTILHPDEPQPPIEDMIPDVLETWKRRESNQNFISVNKVLDVVDITVTIYSKFLQHVIDIPKKMGISIDLMMKRKRRNRQSLDCIKNTEMTDFLKCRRYISKIK